MSDEEHVQPQRPGTHNSSKMKKSEAGDRSGADTLMAQDCYWNDKKYSDGGAVCDSNIRYECWNGKWVDVGQCEGDTGGGSKGD